MEFCFFISTPQMSLNGEYGLGFKVVLEQICYVWVYVCLTQKTSYVHLFQTNKYLGLLSDEGQRGKWYSSVGGRLGCNDAWVKG